MGIGSVSLGNNRMGTLMECRGFWVLSGLWIASTLEPICSAPCAAQYRVQVTHSTMVVHAPYHTQAATVNSNCLAAASLLSSDGILPVAFRSPLTNEKKRILSVCL